MSAPPFPPGTKILFNNFLPTDTVVMHHDALQLPPADPAVDPVRAWATRAVAMLTRHEPGWIHDVDGDNEHDEDCRACEYVDLVAAGRGALVAQTEARTVAVESMKEVERGLVTWVNGTTADDWPFRCTIEEFLAAVRKVLS